MSEPKYSSEEDFTVPASRLARREPNRIPERVHDAGDSVISLQSEMGLADEPERFRDILCLIREVWREYGIDSQVPYNSQKPKVMHAVEATVVKRMPALRLQYEGAWPVRFYLKRALKDHGSQSRIRAHDEAPYIYPGKQPQNLGRRRLPMRAALEKKPHR
ncbi:hypothetical protein C8Q74DRAFT_570058 [Fomes fomentarius]|nr:hypothetical protein C8Q74DRAFT_570058 [Fomes fomentarius]